MTKDELIYYLIVMGIPFLSLLTVVLINRLSKEPTPKER